MNKEKNQDCSGICPCMDPCPLGHALKMIGGKWKIRILCSLNVDGTMRYRDLQNKIQGITPAMLTSSLKELERDGLIVRIQYTEVPMRVEYSLTDHARELWPILHRLAHWSLGVPFDSDEEQVGCAGGISPLP